MSAPTRLPRRMGVSSTSVLLVAAAVAWFVVVVAWGDMGAAPGTMGLDPWAFVVAWTLMVAGMMLPATAPMASLYARTIEVSGAGHRARLVLFVGGYGAVWATTGLAAWAGAGLIDRLVAGHPGAGGLLACAIFAMNGMYQLSGLKQRCLAKCRMPVGLLLDYLSWPGPLRDLRVGAHHGAYCVACCWTIMVLLAAFGVMNLWAMAGLTAVVSVEKLAPYGQRFARSIGVASLALALAVLWLPGLAPGLTHPHMHPHM